MPYLSWFYNPNVDDFSKMFTFQVNVFLQTLKWILQVSQEFMFPRQCNKDENHNENGKKIVKVEKTLNSAQDVRRRRNPETSRNIVGVYAVFGVNPEVWS